MNHNTIDSRLSPAPFIRQYPAKFIGNYSQYLLLVWKCHYNRKESVKFTPDFGRINILPGLTISGNFLQSVLDLLPEVLQHLANTIIVTVFDAGKARNITSQCRQHFRVFHFQKGMQERCPVIICHRPFLRVQWRNR